MELTRTPVLLSHSDENFCLSACDQGMTVQKTFMQTLSGKVLLSISLPLCISFKQDDQHTARSLSNIL